MPGACGSLASLDVGALAREADRHGVLPLVARRVGEAPETPAHVRAAFEAGEPARVAADLAAEAALRQVLTAFEAAGVEALLFKGTQLAFTHYARPDLRPRLDVDLLVRPGDVERAGRALAAIGYVPDVQAGTEGVLYQRPFSRAMPAAPAHVVDLHWRLSNPAVFRQVGGYEDLVAESVPVAALGVTARGLGPLHAMLVACVHRVAHHFDDDRLIWLYDVHLLAASFDDGLWRRLAAEAESRGVAEVCRASLSRAVAAFGTRVPEALLAPAGRRKEVTARYLEPARPHAQVVFDDLRALPTWRARWRTLRAHVLPPAAYMREVYAPDSARPLAWLYAVRAVRGARRWLAGSSRA